MPLERWYGGLRPEAGARPDPVLGIQLTPSAATVSNSLWLPLGVEAGCPSSGSRPYRSSRSLCDWK